MELDRENRGDFLCNTCVLDGDCVGDSRRRVSVDFMVMGEREVKTRDQILFEMAAGHDFPATAKDVSRTVNELNERICNLENTLDFAGNLEERVKFLEEAPTRTHLKKEALKQELLEKFHEFWEQFEWED